MQRHNEEDAFSVKRYNHPLGYIINMILTYFCSKVKFFTMCRVENYQKKWAERTIVAGNSGTRCRNLPEKVAPPLWYIHYFRESRTIPTSMSCQNGMHLGGSSPLSRRMHREASGSEGFWTTMVYHYGICMGETVYTVDFSWLFSGVPAHYIKLFLLCVKQFNIRISP